MIKLTINNELLQLNEPKSLLEIANDLGLKDVLAATTNKRLRELTYVINHDAEIVFLDYNHPDSIRMFESTLRYVVAKAIFNLYPKAKVRFNYSISRSILALFEEFDGQLNSKIVADIEKEVKRIVDLDLPITRKRMDIDEAIQAYERFGMYDKVAALYYREETYVNIYECDGYINYMFGYMLPSTSYLKEFKMFLYNPGFIIQYPRAEFGGKIPEFQDEPTFGMALKQAAKWGEVTKGNTIALMNDNTKTKSSTIDFVQMCEQRHNHQLYELGEIIEKNLDNIRLIGIAGPSSSGKTTFSNRLRIELKTRNIHPIMISIDDYYLGRSEAPRNNDGSPDLEHVKALDVELFNKDMLSLISGEEVTLPVFNFKTGLREKGRTIKVDDHTPIIIEGIHALNDILTRSIPKHLKFKIYIAPQTQLHIDGHNPISITDLRLLRRLVRDQKYRNSSAEETISMWPSVRRGEFKWIYPNQNDADYVFNSELSYEFMILKKHAVAELKKIGRDSEYFIDANRLLKFLKYFVDIKDDLVPNSSLLREFIGGSVFD